jgi:hypothetical protein
MDSQASLMAEKIGPFPYRPIRAPMLAHVDIFSGGMHLGSIQLRNLSSGGLGGSGFALENRDQLDVQLTGIGLTRARVIWVDRAYFGLAFDHEISVGAFDLGGPESCTKPFAAGIRPDGRFHPDERDYPSTSGGCFVRPDGTPIDLSCD